MQFVLQYTTWHYSRGIHDIIVMWSNIVWFLSHFFSLPLLIATLFSPWKRLQEKRKAGFDIEDILSVFLVNIMMRILGFLFRITLIALGLLFLTVALLAMVVHLAIWILFPLVIPALIYYGYVLLFT